MRHLALDTLQGAVTGACRTTALRSLMLLLVAMVLAACSQLFDPPDNTAQLVALQKQLSQIESQVAHLEKTESSGDEGKWVLWYSEASMQDQLAGSSVTPYGAYPTKSGCLDAAATWSIPDGKLIATDPYIIENKTIQVIYRCLPRGVTPYPKS